ncbi:TetR/AcrR family transcriptional regulator [Tsukamurella sp. 8F]|uniref:TetR/AcrR family transcriptional regulator n=1 Tax=unclassified Tsukamurella TaxID=2633480 RepID=UPI0023BA0867|nr:MULTISPECIES: TetR/AcrR family transcriptional regulator [unclassified Tsukamurella]MDF0530237.1 TetR/AcrR family transcriptional regulator [Tsukamurella sp. 8J]MDF0586554.1 TetR/AcrR family transcriptional regulator [Tsukamurella sp. 8F]
MPAAQRRSQLVDIARSVFAERGYEAATVEEIAARAEVSKPVVYEHFGGKEGLYAVVVDREMESVLDVFTRAMLEDRSKSRIEQIALALLTYVDERSDGFRILTRNSSAAHPESGYSTLLNDLVSQVEVNLEGEFDRRGLDSELAPLYAQALVGMVAMTAQWWLEVRAPSKEVVAAHIVNLCWYGLTGLKENPVAIELSQVSRDE